MSQSVDKRIVQMQFDNSQFEKNVATSMSTLERLKKALKLDDTSKGIDEISNAVKKVDMNPLGNAVSTIQAKFSALDVIAVTALQNITNKAVNAGESLVKSLSIDNIASGWEKYNQQNASVQTLLNSTGKSISEVDGYLNRLMWFSDETSYSFTEMESALAQMTSSGGDIDTLIPLITGIANATAYAGKGAREFSSAIYNLNQSYSKGYLDYTDWKSLDIMGVSSKQLKQTLIDVGEELGTIEKGTVTIDNFASTLKDKWATRDVMETAFGKFSEFSEAVQQAVSAGTYDTASEAIAAMSDSYAELGVKAFESGQKAKSFTEAIDATKDAVSSGWMTTFKTIFGNYEESSAMWTTLSNNLWEIFASGAEGRNEMLEKAFGDNTAWSDYVEKVNAAGISTDDFKAAVEEAAKSGKPLSQVLLDFAKDSGTVGTSTEDLNAKLEETQKIFDDVWNGSYGNGADRVKAFAEAGLDYDKIQTLVNEHTLGYKLTLEDLGEEQLAAVGYTEEQIAAIQELAKEAEAGGMSIEELMDAMNKPSGRELFAQTLDNICQSVIGFQTVIREAASEVFDYDFASIIYNFIAAAEKFTKSLIAIDTATGELTDTGKKLKSVFKGAFSIFGTFNDVISAVAKGIKKGLTGAFDGVGESILDFSANLGEGLVSLREWIQQSGILEKITEAVAKVVGTLATALGSLVKGALAKAPDLFNKVSEALSSGVKNIKTWAEESGVLQAIMTALGSVLGVVVDALGKFVSLLASGISSLVKWGSENKIISTTVEAIGKALSTCITTIVKWFKAFADLPIVQNGIKTLKSLAEKLFEALKKGFEAIKPTIDDLIEKIKPAFEDLLDKLGSLESFDIAAIAKAFGEFGQKVVSAFTDGLPFIDKFVSAIEKVKTTVGSAVSFVTEKFGIFKSGVDKVFTFLQSNTGFSFGKLFSGMLSVATVKSLYDLSKVFSSVSSATSDLKSGAVGIMTQISNTFKALQQSIKSDVLLKASVAIATLAGSLIALTLVDTTKLQAVAKVLGSLIGIVGGIAIALEGINALTVKFGGTAGAATSGANFAGMAAMILALSGSMYILSQALKQLDGIEVNAGLIAKVGVLALICAELVGLFAAVKAVNAAIPGSGLTSSGSLLAAAVSLKLVVSALNDIAGFSLDDILAATGKLALIAAAMAGINFASSLGSGGSWKNMLASVIALKLFLTTLDDIINLDAKAIVNHLGNFVLVFNAFAALMLSTKAAGLYAKEGGTAVLLCAAATVIIVEAMKEIADIPEDDLVKAGNTIAQIELIFLAMMGLSKFSGAFADKAGLGILAMSGAAAALVGCIYILTKMDPGDVAQAMNTIKQIELMFALLMVVSKNTENANWKPIIAMGAVVAALALVVTGLSAIPAEELSTATLALDSLMISFGILAACASLIDGKDWKGMVVTLGVMELAVIGLAVVVAAISGIDSTNVLPNATAISEMLVAIGVCLALVGAVKAPASAAITIAATIAAAITAIWGVATIIGGFMQNSGLKSATEAGIEFLVYLAGALGTALGDFIGNIGVALAQKATDIVQELQTTIKKAQLLFIQLKTLSLLGDDAMDGAVALAGVIGEISGATFVAALRTLGGLAMKTIAHSLTEFGTACVSFYNSVSEIKSTYGFKNTAEGAQFLADAISKIYSVNTLFADLKMDKFASSVEDLGAAMVAYAEATEPLADDSKLAGMENANMVAEKMLELGQKISDNQSIFDSLAELLGQKNSMSQFGEGMADFGKGLVEFAKSVQAFGGGGGSVHEIGGLQTVNQGLTLQGDALTEAMDTSYTIAEKLIDFYGLINDNSTLLDEISTLLTGNNSMSNFGKNLKPFAQGLIEYAKTVQAFGGATSTHEIGGLSSSMDLSDMSGIDNSITAAGKILEFGKKIEENKSVMSYVSDFFTGGSISTFASGLKELGTGLANYATSVADVGDLEASITGLQGIADVVGQLQEYDMTKFSDFQQVFADFACTDFDKVLTGFQEIGSGILDNIIEGIQEASEGLPDQISSICQSIADNFGVGIVNAGTTMQTAITTVITNLTTLISSSAPRFTALIPTIATQMVSAITATNGNFVTAANNIIRNLVFKITSSQTQFTTAVRNILTAILNKITESRDQFETRVSNILSVLVLKITSTQSQFENAVTVILDSCRNIVANSASQFVSATDTVLSSCVAAVKGYQSDFSTAGGYLMDGLAEGITKNGEKAVQAAKKVAADVLSASKTSLKEKSPSKATEEQGMYFDMGLANGISGYAGLVTAAADNLGNSAIKNMQNSISNLADMVDSNIDYEPTITPILDLTNVQAGASEIGNLLNGDTLFGLRSMSLASGISSMVAQAKEDSSAKDEETQSAPVTNNYNFTQNNTSPKALSRLDIYRQTKNQFAMMKEATVKA